MSETLETAGPNPEDLLAIRESYGKYKRFVAAALGGIPWVGSIIAAGTALHAEAEQEEVNDLLQQWLQDHAAKLRELQAALAEIVQRVEGFGEAAQKRLNEDDYLVLVRKGFQTWDRAETAEKRCYIRRLLTNAAGTSISTDDYVRLFLDWIERYHEAHFSIIKAIYKNGVLPGLVFGRLSTGETPPHEKTLAKRTSSGC